MNFIKTIVAAGLVAVSTSAFAADITGAGATFPFPIYSKWADAYKKETGNGLNYQSIGSGAGIKQIQAKTVTFGATDAPLKAEQLEKDGLVQWPMVMGAIVPVVNLEGVKPGELVLVGRSACRHLSRQGHQVGRSGDREAQSEAEAARPTPSRWCVVPTVRAPPSTSPTISPRSSADWKTKVGSGTAVEWPVGVGAKGNEGVAGNIGQTKNSIGYVEYAYAKQNKLTYAALVNKAGKTVQPTIAAFQAAASNADWAKAPGYYVILTDQPGEASWPITAATFILMHKEPTDKAASAEAIKFFKWAFEKGDKMAEELDYIPMPEPVVKLIEKTWSADIKS